MMRPRSLRLYLHQDISRSLRKVRGYQYVKVTHILPSWGILGSSAAYVFVVLRAFRGQFETLGRDKKHKMLYWA
jgi:hypothetical protein